METTMNLTDKQLAFVKNSIKRNDDVFVSNEVIDLAKVLNMPTRQGLERGIVSNGALVNCVSLQYGHLPNQIFFGEIERQLNAANIKYVTRSINRDNRSFTVDYILFDEQNQIEVKKQGDKILPMLRFTNSYDGSCKTSGHFGFYRQICSNGLHTTKFEIGFKVKHRGKIVELVMPEIGALVNTFMNNEYYSIANNFNTMAQKTITDVEAFVKSVATDLNLFKFEKSDKNAEPSLNAQLVIDTINKEARILGAEPNFWLGYNAFNELLHDKLKKSFDQQHTLDAKIFDHILEMA